MKKLWKLSKKDPKKVDELLDDKIEALSDEGDGKAIFIGQGSEEEFRKQKDEDRGLKGIFGL